MKPHKKKPYHPTGTHIWAEEGYVYMELGLDPKGCIKLEFSMEHARQLAEVLYLLTDPSTEEEEV